MKNLFEYTDSLNFPLDAFHHTSCYDNFPILPHWHYFIEIIYLLDGKIEATCDHSVYSLFPGDLIIFCPQKIHSVDVLYTPAKSGLNAQKKAEESRLFSSSANPRINTQHNSIYPIPVSKDLETDTSEIQYHVLKFDLNFINAHNSFKTHFSKMLLQAFEQNPENIYFSSEMMQDSSVSSLISTCIQEMHTKEYGYNIIASSLISTLLTQLMRIWQKRGLNLNEFISSDASSNKEFEEITQYIDKHYNESLQVQDLAIQCNMSYSYFAKQFKKTYNQSCKDYIEFIRINKVLDLLRFTNLDLTYISQETGFADCSHLIRTFKKYKGITPKQWRKENNRL